MARQDGACDSLVTAALLRRFGDLVLDARACGAAPMSAAEIAHLGAELLADLYPPLVTETIRLQPSAQRYLATTTLPMSCGTALAEIGWRGPNVAPMTESERACFARLPFAMNAVKLRRWILATTGNIAVERELPALHRIAERSVCNDGFGWGA